MVKLLDFNSIRIIAAISHFVSTTSLYWTKIDSISLSSRNSDIREKNSQHYDILISFCLACLFFHFICMARTFRKITLFNCIRLFLDFVGAFFCLWISLDGLTWKTYICISVICV